MISVVVPIYNEEQMIPLLYRSVVEVVEGIAEDWELVCVNDGSKDTSLKLLLELQAQDPRVVVVDLSRNFGHMGALTAGMQAARGDAVVLMDADLQDPPSVIPEMVAAWRNGAQVVTTVRRSRAEGRKYLAVLFPLFYRVLGALSDFPIPLNSGIFGLFSREALDSLNSLEENNRYLPGLRAWIGYRTAVVYYDRADRAAGDGKLSFMSRIKYALDAICSFSYKPLRLTFVLGGGAICLALICLLNLLLSGRTNLIGYGTVASIFFMGGVQLFCLGVIGEYIGRIYDQARQRPLSIINKVYRAEEVTAREPVATLPVAA